MIRILLAGELNTRMAEYLKAIPEFEIKEVMDDPSGLPVTDLRLFDAAVVDARIPADQEVLSSLENLRLLIRPACDPGNTDMDYARSRGIDVRCTPFATAGTVADYTLALILAGLFRVGPDYMGLRDANVPREEIHRQLLLGRKLTVGVVGFGRIGSEVGRRAFDMRMEVLYADIEEVQADFPARRVPFEHLMATADVVSLHLPLTTETRNMVCSETLSRMKLGSVLVDLSAPGIVDAPEVIRAVKSGRLSAAALDVKNMPARMRKESSRIAGVYPVSGETFLSGEKAERSGNDVVSILKEFFNV